MIKSLIPWWLGMSVVFAVSMYVLFVVPDRWSGAVAVKICRDGSVILRDRGGVYWVRRNAVRAYRVDDAETVCAK